MQTNCKPGDIIDVNGFSDDPIVIYGIRLPGRRNGPFRVLSVSDAAMRIEPIKEIDDEQPSR